MATAIPKNAAPFTLLDVLAVTSGVLVAHGRDAARGVTTDSRTVSKGNLFVALVGERIDAHEHLAAAVERGADILVVSREIEVPPGPSVVRVADTTRALGDLARLHHERWAGGSGDRVTIAVTGSAGKTTTRRAVATLLSGLGRAVHATEGNLNNAIGIPMTLFGIDDGHDVVVLEIGTSGPGEIAYGASLAPPDVTVLTLIAAAHTAGLGSLDHVAEEKGALPAATKTTGVAIANADDARAVAQLARAKTERRLTYGESEDADVRLLARTVLGATGAALSVDLAGQRMDLTTPLLGQAGALATLAALAVAHGMGLALSGEAIDRALAPLSHAEPGRLCPVVGKDGTLVIDDAYNANGASMIASVRAAGEIARGTSKPLVLVLGEMRELGALAQSEHDLVADEVVRQSPRHLIAVSGEARRLADTAQRAGIDARFVPDARAAVAAAGEVVRPGDVVLVKGSRGVGLESVVSSLLGSEAAR